MRLGFLSGGCRKDFRRLCVRISRACSMHSVLMHDQRKASRERPLSGSRIILSVVLCSEKDVHVLVPYRQDAIQLSTQRNFRDAPLLPIVGVLNIADFSAPSIVERISKDRLEFCLGETVAEKVL